MDFLTITGVDYNKSIPAGISIIFGMILKNPGDFDTSNPTTKPVPAPTTDDWLFTDGNKIVDKNGKEAWLTGVNWLAYNNGTNLFNGVWACNLNTTIQDIADRGFNLLRIPTLLNLIIACLTINTITPCYLRYTIFVRAFFLSCFVLIQITYTPYFYTSFFYIIVSHIIVNHILVVSYKNKSKYFISYHILSVVIICKNDTIDVVDILQAKKLEVKNE